MNTPCPTCNKTLFVGDEFAGRRVRCPSCTNVFQLPPAGAGSTAAGVSSNPLVPLTTAPASSDAVQRGTSPRPPATDVKSAPTRRVAEVAPSDDDKGRCYIQIGDDEVKLNKQISKLMAKYIETEDLPMRVVDADAPDDLGPNDLIISGQVELADYGNQFIRWLLPIIALCGPGACVLTVDAVIEAGEGENQKVRATSRRWAGFYGGSGVELMKQNVQVVGTRIAQRAVRHASGRTFLNAQAYSNSTVSLILGLMSLIPFIGVLFGMIGIVYGLIALVVISGRGLPHGKIRSIAGILLSFVGFAVTLGVVLLTMKSW